MSIHITVLPRNVTLLLLIAFAFIALGIFVHGRVLPVQPADEAPVATAEANHLAQPVGQGFSHEPPDNGDITAELKQAIEQEHRQAAETAALLQQRVAQTKRQLNDAQRIRQSQGSQVVGQNDEAKQQAFASKLNALKAQLAEMQ
ncbi:MAG: hypothetical protein P8179_11770 [Candidatus Thiodiazotropha sp.]